MTNAEKFLKDGVDINQFAEMIGTAYTMADFNADVCESTINWLKEQVKPTLTEDEEVILRNIDNTAFKTIGRNKFGGLYLKFYFMDESYKASIFKDNLFQFIKNGEEYEIKELLKNDL